MPDFHRHEPRGQLLEGVFRRSVLVRAFARIAPGSRNNQMVISMDWLLTLVSLSYPQDSARPLS
ncbi:MAG: hypothetical protein KGJ57_19125 [Sphingomonadales bacterium]|nr:hypothetical protein [Sphingomonadales bacterium]MDE2171510.1 hypothetical protein [Sphingomonadales bacterium]